MTDSQEQKSISDLSTRPIGRLLWEYSMPAIVGMVVMSLYNVIDRIFIGRGVGAEAIAGLAITFPVMNISAAIGVLIGAGAAARVSIMLGQRDRRGAEEVLGNSTVLILVNAIVYLTFFAIFLDDILRLFGASDITLPYAHDFMAYLLPGMLIMNVMYSLNNVMRATGYPKQAMITMFIGAGCNVVLAPIFIFVLDMGIKGAAIATDISMTVGMIFVLAHFFNKKSTVHFRRGIYRLKWRIIIGIIGIGAAPSIINAASCAINILINRTLVDRSRRRPRRRCRRHIFYIYLASVHGSRGAVSRRTAHSRLQLWCGPYRPNETRILALGNDCHGRNYCRMYIRSLHP